MSKIDLLARLLRAELRALIAENKAELRIHPGAERDVIERLLQAGVSITEAGDISLASTDRPSASVLEFVSTTIRAQAQHLFV